MAKEEAGVNEKRRNFLKLASASVPAVAVSATLGTQASADVVTETSGLQDTAHTRAYLETARF